jgi:hypothetical protein
MLFWATFNKNLSAWMHISNLLNFIFLINFAVTIDNSSYRPIFYLDKKDEIYHYRPKEHPKITKIAKIGCEML